MSDGNIDYVDPVLIAMLRRVMPNLMVYDVAGVQPMRGPTGLIFALKGANTALFPAHTGSTPVPPGGANSTN